MKKLPVFCLFLVGLIASFAQKAPTQPKAARPNIIVLLVDDVGYSDIGCYGGEIKTPNLDRLAANGIRMTQVYNSARCCPTRASLLTGLQPHQVGLGHMSGSGVPKGNIGYNGFRNDNNLTIAEALKSAGYFTAMSGKWHIDPGTPISRGFDEYYGMLGGFGSCWNPKLYKRLPEGRPERTYQEGEFYATDAITDHAMDFTDMAKQKNNPFFLYLAYNAPHFPLHAPKAETDKYFDYYKRGWDKIRAERYERMKKLGVLETKPIPELSKRGDVPGSNRIAEPYPLPAWDTLSTEKQLDLARRMAIYAGMLDRLDQNVGRLLDHLKQQNQLDNTLIIFLSDNGGCAEWSENGFDGSSGLKFKLHTGAELDGMGLAGTYHHYGTGWANVSNTPFNSYKHYAYEGGISTPFILYWPAGINRKNKIDHRPCHITDIMATCLDVAGVTYPATRSDRKLLPLEGMSLVPVMQGKPTPDRTICVEHEGNRMIRQGDWKLVSANYKANSWELYNIKNDRSEQHNLAAQQPDRVRTMAAHYDKWAAGRNVVDWDLISPFKGKKITESVEK